MKRGFASRKFSRARQREIAAAGGRAVFKRYGRRHMQEIGRRGGYNSHN